jgi:hypothetical protein
MILVLVVIAAVPSQRARFAPVVIPTGAFTDVDLYRATTARVQSGENYYIAAAAEQRRHGYPTAPAATFRPPFEAYLLAALRSEVVRWAVLLGLAGAVTIALRNALDQVPLSGRGRLAAMALMATGLANAGTPGAPYMHEVWASLLIALSLALYRPQNYVASVLLGLAACLFREIAAPYLSVMFLFAVWQGRRREAMAWVAAAVLFVLLMTIHLHLASLQHRPGDLVTAGWFKFGGWRFILTTARRNILLAYAPGWIVATAVCLSLVGLVGATDPWSARVAAVVCTFTALFAVAGRPDNYCWGILDAPQLPFGLIFAPAALRALLDRALGAPFTWPPNRARASASVRTTPE